jgi:hypothetical protein
LLGLAACRGEDPNGPGRIEISWTGADTGKLTAPALARWCANDSLVEITGAVGDSGVAVAMLPPDTAVAPGSFPVGMPLRVHTRPAARVALRWMGETLTEGYYSLHGTVTLDSAVNLSGSLRATLRNVNDSREISLNGTFTRIRLQTGSAESCGVPAFTPVDTGGQ